MACALPLATNTKFPKFGWIAFLISNAALIALFLRMGTYGLLAQQAFITATSVLGLGRQGMLGCVIRLFVAVIRRPRSRARGRLPG
jgi:hypothetical protein